VEECGGVEDAGTEELPRAFIVDVDREQCECAGEWGEAGDWEVAERDDGGAGWGEDEDGGDSGGGV